MNAANQTVREARRAEIDRLLHLIACEEAILMRHVETLGEIQDNIDSLKAEVARQKKLEAGA